jgi:hypothetical protein
LQDIRSAACCRISGAAITLSKKTVGYLVQLGGVASAVAGGVLSAILDADKVALHGMPGKEYGRKVATRIASDAN